MKQLVSVFCPVVLLFSLLSPAVALSADALDDCLLDALKYAEDSVTVGQLRQQCREETGTISRAGPQARPAVAMAADGPAEMVLKTEQAKKPAFFPHRKHQEKYPCGTCHHGRTATGALADYTEKTIIYKCTFCHNESMPNEKLNGFQLVGHQLCRECHRTHQNSTSAKCSTCHR